MKGFFASLALFFLLFSLADSSVGEPPFERVTDISQNVINEHDESAYIDYAYLGTENRWVSDIRTNVSEEIEVLIFGVAFEGVYPGEESYIEFLFSSKDFNMESAEAELPFYGHLVGQSPRVLLKEGLSQVTFLTGEETWSSGGGDVTIHIGMTPLLTDRLEEIWLHELAHAVSWLYYNHTAWKEAMEADGSHITVNATSSYGEDWADSFGAWLVTLRPDRVSASTIQLIEDTISKRLAYLRGLRLNLNPFVDPMANWLMNDFNGDRMSDLPWRDMYTGQNRLWLMNGPVRESAGSVPMIDPNWILAGTGDFNNDGMVDYYWRDTVLGINRIWYMDGLTRTGFERTFRMKDQRWQVGAICDLNNDGYADIIWRHSELPQTRAWIMQEGVQVDRGALPKASNDWSIAGCADFDGDGNDDLLWRNPDTGHNRIWLMDGVLRVDSDAINIASTNFRVGGVGDFTNDGKADILLHDDVAGRSLLWEMDGLTRLEGQALKLQHDKSLLAVAIGDYGGDGNLDIFWRDPSTGESQFWNMDGATRLSVDNVTNMSPDYSPLQ